MNKFLLEGKTAVITGAGRAGGIGCTIAELYAQEGASVAIVDFDLPAAEESAARINANGGKAIAVYADVSKKADCDAAFQKAVDAFGHVDILVNNAGIISLQTIDNTDDKTWEHVMALNLNGTFYFARAAVKHMLPRNEGCIINVASAAGMKPISGCAYSTSKGAVVTLTKNIAYRLTQSNIRCNCICPGRVETNLQKLARAEAVATKDVTNMHPFGDKYVNRDIPVLGPVGQANVALFLASDLAQDIAGVIMHIASVSGHKCAA